MVRKKWINTFAIVTAEGRIEKNKIFGEDNFSYFFICYILFLFYFLIFWQVWLYVADNMDKLQMFYNLGSAQGIKNGPTSQAMVPPLKDTAPTPTTKIVSSVPRVEQLSNDVTTETMRDTTYFSISTMRGWDIDQNSPLEEVSLGRNCLSGKDATWAMTPFLQMSFVFPFRFDCTPEEAATIVSIEYQSFFQSLS